MVDSCLRDLVKMLDSKCETVSSEAVVALRTLLQSTNDAEKSGEGGIGTLNKGQFWIQVVFIVREWVSTDLCSSTGKAKKNFRLIRQHKKSVSVVNRSSPNLLVR